MRLLSYWPARKGTAYSLSLHSVRMCSAVLRYVGRLRAGFGGVVRAAGLTLSVRRVLQCLEDS